MASELVVTFIVALFSMPLLLHLKLIAPDFRGNVSLEL